MTDPSSPSPAGWFPDPLGRHDYRYFNGSAWTADVSDDGHRMVDPFGARPSPLGFQQAHPPAGRNGIATAAMVCGLIGVLIAWIPFVVVAGLILAILALVFGIRGLRRSTVVGSGRNTAITGIVTGVIGLALAVLGIALSVIVFRAVADFVDPGPVTVDGVTCELADGEAIVTGELTNRSHTTRDYTVFVDVAGQTEVVALDDVERGASATFVAHVGVGPEVSSCDPDVTPYGPFPFGIQIDPIEN